MTTYGKEKASVIASVAAALKSALLPAIDEGTKELVAGQVGTLLEAGYDLADIRYAAIEIALIGDPTWSLCSRVKEEFEVNVHSPGLPVVPVRNMDGRAHDTHLYKAIRPHRGDGGRDHAG